MAGTPVSNEEWDAFFLGMTTGIVAMTLLIVLYYSLA